MLSILFPFSFIIRTVQVLKAPETFQVSRSKSPIVRADADEEHEALSFEIAIDKVAFIVISGLEVENTLAPDLIVMPLALIGVTVSVIHGTEAFFHSKIEVAFVPISIAG
jgi:hypothetical protein